jgi:hypothetical protein
VHMYVCSTLRPRVLRCQGLLRCWTRARQREPRRVRLLPPCRLRSRGRSNGHGTEGGTRRREKESSSSLAGEVVEPFVHDPLRSSAELQGLIHPCRAKAKVRQTTDRLGLVCAAFAAFCSRGVQRSAVHLRQSSFLRVLSVISAGVSHRSCDNAPESSAL